MKYTYGLQMWESHMSKPVKVTIFNHNGGEVSVHCIWY